MILKSLSLRGAKGIKYGMGLEELNIDFTKFQPGLVAITGRNGSGKTTLLENLTPFRTLFSRKGKLQKHFYLPDSHRILEFQIGEDHYKAEIYIDVSRDKTGAVLYKNGKDIALAPREYDIEIDKLFLGKSLFEQSLFFGQDTERISDLRAGEAKEFMIKLLRLDMAQALHKRAALYTNEALRVYETEVERQKIISDRIELQGDLEDTLKAVQEEFKTFQETLKLKHEALQRINKKFQVLEDVKRCKDVIKKCDSDVEEWHQKGRDRAQQNRTVLSEYSSDALNTQLSELRTSLYLITQEEFDTYNDLKTTRNALNIKKSAFSERLQEAQAARSEIEAHRLVKKSIVEKNISLLEERIKRAEKVIGIIDEVPCVADVGENCLLLKDAHKAKIDLETHRQQLGEAQERLKEILEHRKDESDELSERARTIRTKLNPIEEELEIIVDKIQSLGNVESQWQTKQQQLLEINNIEHKISTCAEVLSKEDTAFKESKNLILEEVRKLQEIKIHTEASIHTCSKDIDFDTLEDTKVQCEHDIKIYNTSVLQTTTRIGELQQQLKEINTLRVELKGIKRAARTAMQTLGDWRSIERAFGKDGIQSFEIKQALPAIVQMMNELLIGELGQKFSLNFRMKRLGTKGQLIDTFDPLITRYENDQIVEEEVPLTNLSRGERILVFVAMSEAVGVYLRNSIGLDLKTSFVDEADGPLDPTNRADYLRTRSHIHGLCGLHHTFIISQSPDIYDVIPQKLILQKGNVEVII